MKEKSKKRITRERKKYVHKMVKIARRWKRGIRKDRWTKLWHRRDS